MVKRTPLVCQHLENISREALGKYQDIIRQYVRRRHGVYALYRRGKLHYVGLASNLRSRLGHHLRDRHQDSWDRFSVYLTIGVMSLCEGGKDDYSLEIENLQVKEMDELENNKEAPPNARGKNGNSPKQATLFDLAGGKGRKRND